MLCDKCGKTETLEQYRADIGWYIVHLKTGIPSEYYNYLVVGDAKREHDFCAACVDEFLAPVRKREQEEEEQARRKREEEREREQQEIQARNAKLPLLNPSE